MAGRSADRAKLAGPILASGALFGLYWFFDVSGAGRDYEILLGKDNRNLLFAAYVPVILLVVRVFDALAFDVVVRRRGASIPQLLRDIVAIALYFILFASAISNIFDFDVKAVLTTGTVLAAILGLALQDTLGNLFSGIALHMEDSFEVGDVLRSGDHIGLVEGVSWRATRIRTFNNNLVILPNSALARERIEVFPRQNLNARVLSIGVDYHVPPVTVIEVLTQAAAHVDGVARDMPCFARVAAFGDSALTYEVKYFTRDYSARDRIDADIRKAIWYALKRNEISIAFPVRSYQAYVPPKAVPHHAVSRDELLARLMAVDLLAPLSKEDHERLGDSSTVHFYSKGETVLRAGAEGDSMFVLHEGQVSIRVPDDSPLGLHEVAQLDAGSVFGEMALLTGERRTADVAALSDVIAIEIGKAALDPILHRNPELTTALAAKVMDRRDRLDSFRSMSMEDVEKTLISRIRSYFGL